jgi:hypothetical protein
LYRYHRGHTAIPEVVLPDYEGELWAEWDDAAHAAKSTHRHHSFY